MLYDVDPSAPSVIPPNELIAWFNSAYIAPRLIPNPLSIETEIAREDLALADLTIRLGQELYKRDHGTYPPDPSLLVGPYLKSLPTVDSILPRAPRTAP
jgi:hypothetical protein